MWLKKDLFYLCAVARLILGLIARLIVRLIARLIARLIVRLIEIVLKMFSFSEISLESKLYLRYQILYLVFSSFEVVRNQIVNP